MLLLILPLRYFSNRRFSYEELPVCPRCLLRRDKATRAFSDPLELFLYFRFLLIRSTTKRVKFVFEKTRIKIRHHKKSLVSANISKRNVKCCVLACGNVDFCSSLKSARVQVRFLRIISQINSTQYWHSW